MYESKTTVINRSGLHARPAAIFVSEAKKYASQITVKNLTTGKSADAKSMLKLLTLSILTQTPVCISAQGNDEQQAVENLITLINAGCGEESA